MPTMSSHVARMEVNAKDDETNNIESDNDEVIDGQDDKSSLKEDDPAPEAATEEVENGKMNEWLHNRYYGVEVARWVYGMVAVILAIAGFGGLMVFLMLWKGEDVSPPNNEDASAASFDNLGTASTMTGG